PPPSTLFPYTTLFRSRRADRGRRAALLGLEGGRLAAAGRRPPLRLPAGVAPYGFRRDETQHERLREPARVAAGRDAARVEIRKGDRKSTRLNSSHVKI